MKKLLKVIGLVVGIVIALAGAGAAFISIRGIPSYEPGNISLKVESTPERVARGKKLSGLLCQHCHLDPKTGSLTGRYVDDVPAEFGKVFSPNITQSTANGIGEWTDGELAYLLRTGIKRNGHYAPPWMVKLPLISDEDLMSIICYLRSDDPMVIANDAPDQPSEPSFLSKFLCHVAFKPLPYPQAAVLAPDTADHVAYGRYLAVGVVDCYSCHSEDFKTMDIMVPENTPGFFGGGNSMLDVDGAEILTANITPHETNGIGKWTKEEFAGAVMYGRRPDGRQLRIPMFPYVGFDTSEVYSIYEYLRTVPVIDKSIARNFK